MTEISEKSTSFDTVISCKPTVWAKTKKMVKVGRAAPGKSELASWPAMGGDDVSQR